MNSGVLRWIITCSEIEETYPWRKIFVSNFLQREKPVYQSAGFDKLGSLGFQFIKEISAETEAQEYALQIEHIQQLSAADNKNPAATKAEKYIAL